MMNLTRGEPFSVELAFDGDTDMIEDYALTIAQNGRSVLHKGAEDAVFYKEEQRALATFDGRETGRLRAGEPAFIQLRVRLTDGEALHSGVEEIAVAELLDAREETPWR